MPRLRCLREGLLPLLSTCTRRGGGVRLGGQVLSVSALVAERHTCSAPQRQTTCTVKALGKGTRHSGVFLTQPLARLCFGALLTDARPDGHVHVADKPDEIVPASKPSRTAESVAVESRVATIKQRPTSRCFPSVSDVNVSGWAGGAGGRPTWADLAVAVHPPQRPDPEPRSAYARQAPHSSADPQWEGQATA